MERRTPSPRFNHLATSGEAAAGYPGVSELRRETGISAMPKAPRQQYDRRAKCDALFEHFYEGYCGDGGSVYSDAA